jgi:DNA-directed RNA polymerase III subunit RPC1
MATTTETLAVPVKQQVVDRLPKRFASLKFGIQ